MSYYVKVVVATEEHKKFEGKKIVTLEPMTLNLKGEKVVIPVNTEGVVVPPDRECQQVLHKESSCIKVGGYPLSFVTSKSSVKVLN